MNGCTTSLQAEVALKPVINYVPKYNIAMADFSLFDDIGNKVSKIDEVIETIHKTYNNDFNDFKIGLWEDKEESFSLEKNFFDEIFEIVLAESKKIRKSSENLKKSFININIYILKSKIKNLLKINRKIRDNDLNNLKIYYNGIEKNFNENLRLDKIFENCYCIEEKG
jgi:hypothetical protein